MLSNSRYETSQGDEMLRVFEAANERQTAAKSILKQLAYCLAPDTFVRTNRRAIAMVFILPSVCLKRAYTVIISADLSLRSDSPIFWAS